MVNRPRNIGTHAETAVARVLQSGGWPHAERRALRGTHDCGDITGTPGICWEVKGGEAARNASDGQIVLWLADTERERVNARANFGVLVVQRRGVGAGNAGRWWAVMRAHEVARLIHGIHDVKPNPVVRLHLTDVMELLRSAGYGEPLDRDGAA